MILGMGKRTHGRDWFDLSNSNFLWIQKNTTQFNWILLYNHSNLWHNSMSGWNFSLCFFSADTHLANQSCHTDVQFSPTLVGRDSTLFYGLILIRINTGFLYSWIWGEYSAYHFNFNCQWVTVHSKFKYIIYLNSYLKLF